MTHPEIARLRRDLLQAHRQPEAWWRFFAGSWAVARATARDHPALRHTWQRQALWRALTLPLLARVLGSSPAHPAWWTTYVVQLADLYVHLGRTRRGASCALRRTFPLATEVTLLRAYAAAALWSGTPRPRLALGLGLATDVLDGALARRRGEATALGALLDGEYDAALWLAAARTARRRRALSPGAEAILWLRFGMPLLAGVLAYGVAPEPVAARSRCLGQIAGSLQAALLWAALSGREQRRPRRVVLLAGTTVLAWAAHVVAYRAADDGRDAPAAGSP